ncbi:hypothetical protein DFQ14_10166 [Halopolyspora algeriensis]|uniref:Uncharacterized protein n=1 Tax=Halopolyspora algeriensis TaxID=1500506 RepID=A0A368W3T3_9ACTN|nr:hypothetical protein [Halopolyspora algeriensis]RCW46730.1 hypothetical protein DFQ14_10166 [Halopolyspora algeriensis]TQM46755.1 hypothetical protein FHU43_3876 [Halopolyspora algeriensis]
MGQPGGPSYDGDAMEAVARDTEALGAAFEKAQKPVKADKATADCFGLLGGETMVGAVFENTRDELVDSLGKAKQHVQALAEGARNSFAEMDTRDAAESQSLGRLQGEM